MSALMISTKKGLFWVEGKGKDARITRSAFLGDNVVLTMKDRRDGASYAVLDHGHFGVKLHRSEDDGVSWKEIAIPAYPEKPKDFVDKDMWGKEREWATKNIWALVPALDAKGALWCGRGFRSFWIIRCSGSLSSGAGSRSRTSPDRRTY